MTRRAFLAARRWRSSRPPTAAPDAGPGRRVAAVPRQRRRSPASRPRRCRRRSRCAGPSRPGDAVESSAAIAGGVAYVGSQKGELLALDLADRQAALALQDRRGHRRVVAGGVDGARAGLRRRSERHRARRARRRRPGGVDVQDQGRGQVVAGRRRRQGGDRLVRRQPLRPRRQGRHAGLDRATPRTTCTARRPSSTASPTSPAATRCSAPSASATARTSARCRSAPTPARRSRWPNGRAYFGTFENEVLAVDLAAKKVVWRYQPKERQFPFYSSAAIADGKVILGGRDKVVHAIDAASGKAVWTFPTKARVESSAAVAGGARLHRLERRPLLRARSRRPASRCGSTNRARR